MSSADAVITVVRTPVTSEPANIADAAYPRSDHAQLTYDNLVFGESWRCESDLLGPFWASWGAAGFMVSYTSRDDVELLQINAYLAATGLGRTWNFVDASEPPHRVDPTWRRGDAARRFARIPVRQELPAGVFSATAEAAWAVLQRLAMFTIPQAAALNKAVNQLNTDAHLRSRAARQACVAAGIERCDRHAADVLGIRETVRRIGDELYQDALRDYVRLSGIERCWRPLWDWVFIIAGHVAEVCALGTADAIGTEAFTARLAPWLGTFDDHAVGDLWSSHSLTPGDLT